MPLSRQGQNTNLFPYVAEPRPVSLSSGPSINKQASWLDCVARQKVPITKFCILHNAFVAVRAFSLVLGTCCSHRLPDSLKQH